ncbi:probable protein S-acyltransferase 22 isoform X2 [Tripterygium wilfordii]|uniref:probable protein S-acyltransferase 22 isoform X2 n=1 Tax=Tripterygium wilfordii TaxID=458696 RepID=UPI0018F83839|nr:probable protein S-acyltransferase 22 isoform X2 [Tripterygium wilfordii]
MRKHGWQLPYHPLQVVAVAVFLALGFAFYVFFAPFVGKKMFQYIAVGIYTPLIACVFGLYIWCAAADPADTGVFRSKKYINNPGKGKNIQAKDSKLAVDSTSSVHESNAPSIVKKHADSDVMSADVTPNDPNTDIQKQRAFRDKPCCFLLVFSPCAFICNCSNPNEESSEQQLSEDGTFYCSLCEVEVFKYSKHCRVCDKCVDRFDHHCRWLNNCIGKKNYRQFFTLMVFALLLLIIQWSTGILVLVCCFLERKRYSVDVSSKLGSSFSLVPFIIVVGISTYDYIVALREQEQEQEQQVIGGQQSPQMSTVSSLTGLSSASSFSTFHRATWCTPPRLFLEDQFDVVPPEIRSVSSLGKKMVGEEPVKKRNPAVKISPWTLARLNVDEVSKAAGEARKRSKILHPVTRQETSFELEADSSFGSSGRRVVARPDNNRRRASKRMRLPADLPVEPITNVSAMAAEKGFSETSTSLAPLQLEARSAFQTSRAMSTSAGVVASSPESSLDSPDIHPFRVSSSGAEESRQLTGFSGSGAVAQRGIPFSRSTSDGYEASGGEDSDQVPSRNVQRSANWNNILFSADHDERLVRLKTSSSSSHVSDRKI